MPKDFAGTRSSRRGAVLLAAISVLAILTILVMGLVASHAGFRSVTSANETKRGMTESARMALARAAAHLGSLPGELEQAVADTAVPVEEEGVEVRYALRPAKSDDSIYAGGFLRRRPGDAVATVRVRDHDMALSQVHLVNVQEGRSRSVLLQSVLGGAKAAPTGD